MIQILYRKCFRTPYGYFVCSLRGRIICPVIICKWKSEISAGCAADKVELCVQDSLLALENVVGKHLGDEVVDADTLDGTAETLAGNALLTIDEKRLLDESHDLVLGVDTGYGRAHALSLAQIPPMVIL